MGKLHWFIALAGSAAVVWLLYQSNSTPTPSATTTVTPLDPRDLEFVQLLDCRDKPDPMRTLELLDTSGSRWYCDPFPGVNLEAVDPEKCQVYADENNKYVIFVGVKPEYQKRLMYWTRERVGESVGVYLNGSIRFVSTVHAQLRSGFVINNVGSKAEAEALGADLRTRARRL